MKKVLIYGFYQKSNLGDNFFINVFQRLFPNYELTFIDYLNDDLVQDYDAIFLGGGSFLDQAASITLSPVLLTKPIFYLGVGAETDIHPIHLELLKAAKLIAIRSDSKYDYLKSINENVIIIPDLVYCQQSGSYQFQNRKYKSVLIIPNICTVPSYSDPHWKHLSWEFFKNEMAQFIDHLLSKQYKVQFFPMQSSEKQNDNWAAIEIINKMKNGSSSLLIEERSELLNEIVKLFSQYETIITQRYHGKVLADLANVPCLTIAHHDKLQNLDKDALSYYGLNKQMISERFYALPRELSETLPIKSNSYEELQKMVNSLIGG